MKILETNTCKIDQSIFEVSKHNYQLICGLVKVGAIIVDRSEEPSVELRWDFALELGIIPLGHVEKTE